MNKCQFHEDEIRFLRFVVLAQDIKIKEEKNEAMKDLPELKSIRDILMFLAFTNFYQKLIRNFSKTEILLFSIFQITNKSIYHKL